MQKTLSSYAFDSVNNRIELTGLNIPLSQIISITGPEGEILLHQATDIGASRYEQGATSVVYVQSVHGLNDESSLTIIYDDGTSAFPSAASGITYTQAAEPESPNPRETWARIAQENATFTNNCGLGLFVRNEANDAWLPIAAVRYYDNGNISGFITIGTDGVVAMESFNYDGTPRSTLILGDGAQVWNGGLTVNSGWIVGQNLGIYGGIYNDNGGISPSGEIIGTKLTLNEWSLENDSGVLLWNGSPIGSGSPRVKYASQLTPADSNLSPTLGDTPSGTNGTAALQEFLGTASASNPIKLIVDGAFLVDGLTVSSYTHIDFLSGSGFVQPSQNQSTQRPVLVNAGFLDSTNVDDGTGFLTVKRAQDAFISITGAGICNCNKASRYDWGGVSTSNPITGNPLGVIMAGIKEFVWDGPEIWNSSQWAFCPSNLYNFYVGNVRVRSQLKQGQQDGIHFLGPCYYGTAEHLRIESGDDALATTHPDGADSSRDCSFRHIRIRDVIFENADTGLRYGGIPSGSTSTWFDDVIFENFGGNVTGLHRGTPDGLTSSGASNFGDVSILGWRVYAGTTDTLAETYFGDFNNAHFSGSGPSAGLATGSQIAGTSAGRSSGGGGGYTPVTNSAVPTIETPNVGDATPCSNGSWDGTPTGYTYQWQISSDGSTGWSDISGATTNSYTPLIGDLGKYLHVTVTASDGTTSDSATSTASPAITNIARTLLTTLRAFWSLSEASGTRADSTGNGFDLSDNNAVSSSAQTIGTLSTTAAVFDGSSNYLSCGSANILNNAPAFSAVAWVNTAGGGWFALCDDSLQLSLGHGGGMDGANFYIPGPGLNLTDNVNRTGEWHLLGITYNSAGDFVGYVDGTEIGRVSAIGTSLNTDTDGIKIGCNQNATYFEETSGSTQGPSAIWLRELGAAAMTALYNSGTPVAYSDLGSINH